MLNRKPKVGIMTWYSYRNYGSALQASALSYAISKLGYEPVMINYQPKGNVVVRRDAKVINYIARPLGAITRRKYQHYVSQEREELFVQYMDARTTETSPRNTHPELFALNEELDGFVCGSDQIWAPSCFDEKYFLSFVEDSGKKVAYAPSIGLPQVKDASIRAQMAKWISEFEHLSVREQQGADTIRSLTGKNAKVVADPTLLMKAEEWDLYADLESCAKIQRKYIVCYFLGTENRYINYVSSLSEKTGLPVYVIPVTKAQCRSTSAVPFEVGPSEFVSLVRNAAYVCTDSFHGMAFSLNYGIPFFVFKRFADNDPKNQNSRILSLLNLVNLEERLVDPDGSLDEALLSCDFSLAKHNIGKLRENSLEYLKTALACATAEKNGKEDKTYVITDMCCGCGACAAVCPKQAISITRNENGFEHYSINSEKCVRCGKCKTVCPYYRIDAPSIRESQKLYAVKSNDREILSGSSSGGVGWELAKDANEVGAWVCGCVYDVEQAVARHIMISPNRTEQLPLLKGSKYIQSISSNAMKQIAALPRGERLYFFGTPCQCAAVDKLMRGQQRREDVLIIDLVCHGVPSYLLWQRYLRELNISHGTGLCPAVEFRRKEAGWRKRSICISGTAGTYQQNEVKDDFYAIFRRGLCDMRTCFDCPYREHSGADIRIGDYWGPRFEHDKTGVSMVIANTVSGAETVEKLKISGKCSVQEYPLDEYWTVQYPYNHPIPTFRQTLIDELRASDRSLAQIRQAYCKCYDMDEAYNRVVKHIKKLLRKGRA